MSHSYDDRFSQTTPDKEVITLHKFQYAFFLNNSLPQYILTSTGMFVMVIAGPTVADIGTNGVLAGGTRRAVLGEGYTLIYICTKYK